MAEDPLVQLPGPAHTAAAVGEDEVVEDQELAGLQLNLDLDV